MSTSKKVYAVVIQTVAVKKEENVLPEPLISLYDPTAASLGKEALEKLSIQLYSAYNDSYTQEAYNHLREETKNQVLSKNWMLHRAGRITASTCYHVSKTKIEKPSRSLINNIMQYDSQYDNRYTRYGKSMEPIARDY